MKGYKIKKSNSIATFLMNEQLFAGEEAVFAQICPFKSVILLFGVKARYGRNSPWKETNGAPEKFYKTRQLYVDVPVTGVPYTIIFSVQFVSGIESGERCFLSLEDKKKGQLTQTVRISCNGHKAEKIRCYLRSLINREEQDGKPKYQVSVAFSCKNELSLLHSWTTTPIRNHKWESGMNGRLQNSRNTDKKTLLVFIQEDQVVAPVEPIDQFENEFQAAYEMLNDDDIAFFDEMGPLLEF